MWQATSDDDGETWENLRRMSINGNTRPDLITLRDGGVLLCWGNRGRKSHAETMWGEEPFGVRAMVSRDEGETWSSPIIIREEVPNEDHGYPSSVDLGDGKIFTVYWYNFFQRYYIAGTHWQLPC